MSQNSSSFKMKAENLTKALKALQDKLRNGKLDMSYVSNEYEILHAEKLNHALDELSWELKFEKPKKSTITIEQVSSTISKLLDGSRNGEYTKEFIEEKLEGLLNRMPKELDVIGISFTGESFANDIELFSVIAPYVEKDSFIEMCGAEGEIWRWVFDGLTCEEKKAKMNW